MSRETTPTENVVAELRRAVMNGEDGCGTLPAKESVKVRPQDWHRITRLAREAAALIESQRAELAASQARVTALEAEKAGAVKLADGYGIVLMMIAAGCSDPQRFAKRILAEYAPEAKKIEATK